MPPGSPAIIRRFRDEDAADVQQCMVDEQNALRLFDTRKPEGAAMVEEYFIQVIDACSNNGGVIYVSEVGGRVVGFVTLLTRVPHSGADDVPGTYAAIMDVAILAGWQGRGLGTALLLHAESEAAASGASELRLSALALNRRAIDLYTRLGYEPYAVTMTKRLDL